MKSTLVFFVTMFSLTACHQAQQTTETVTNNANVVFFDEAGNELQPIQKTEAEWKAELTAQEYNVLREEGTERAFTGDLLANKEEGVYVCSACSLPLFASSSKFKSGTGWPSFYEPITKGYVGEIVDNRYGMRRVEVECNRCGGHLGHVFDDGPQPTGLRYCINSISLDFKPMKLKDVKKP